MGVWGKGRGSALPAAGLALALLFVSACGGGGAPEGPASAVSGGAAGAEVPPGGEPESLPSRSFIPASPVPSADTLFPADNSNRYTEDEKINIRVYDLRNEGVVNITTAVLAYNWFLEPVPQMGGTGSGSIIDAQGYVLTNRHVVEGAYKVFLTLADGTQTEGTVIGSDPDNDLSVIRFDPGGKKLSPIPMGSSQGIRVGQKVIAIGNPFGFDRTLTTGIVSGVGRPIQIRKDGSVIRNMIQTDASINPGNSGGPLLDSQGNMIGINTVIYSPSGGSVGIGFAVPVDTARRSVPEIIRHGRVLRGWIDIVPVPLFSELVEYAKLPVSRGLLISRLIAGGNAARAGLRGGSPSELVRHKTSLIYLGGDIIVEVDGAKVESVPDLLGALENRKPGDQVQVTAYRGREKKVFTLVLSERPESFQWE